MDEALVASQVGRQAEATGAGTPRDSRVQVAGWEGRRAGAPLGDMLLDRLEAEAGELVGKAVVVGMGMPPR